MAKDKIKICLVTSPGGHLFQLYQLQGYWSQYDHFWITKNSSDVNNLLSNEKKYYGHFPEQRNIINTIKNTFLAIKIISTEKPTIILSTGAGIAPPFFLIGKLFGCKLIFIEAIDFIKFPTLSGRLLYPLVDLFIVQSRLQKKFYPRSVYWGKTL